MQFSFIPNIKLNIYGLLLLYFVIHILLISKIIYAKINLYNHTFHLIRQNKTSLT